jgi:fatty acid desaturase
MSAATTILVRLFDGDETTESSDYRRLAGQVRNAGLMERRPWYYATRFVVIVAAMAAAAFALFLVGNSPVAIAVAAVMAIAFAQVAFIGHDAGHLQVFRSKRANRLVGLIVGNLLTGMSVGWWVPKHNAHHGHPNQVDRDPDIAAGAFAFTDEIARNCHGVGRWMARRQAWLFFPILTLEGFALNIASVWSVLKRRDRAAGLEAALLVAHTAGYLTIVFWALSPWWALAFIAVHQAVFGLYLGCSFAPNHKGMPIIEADSPMGFARRQILTARNITGGRFTTFVFGGLNYQIEHHLFPTMPRPNLRGAQAYVRAFCAERRLPYCEASLVGSYRQALTHLARVGSGTPDTVPML